jgi:hypothetical protein
MQKSSLLIHLVIIAAFCSGYAFAGEDSGSGPTPLNPTQLERWSDSEGFKRGVASADANIQRNKLIFRSRGFAISPKSQRHY